MGYQFPFIPAYHFGRCYISSKKKKKNYHAWAERDLKVSSHFHCIPHACAQLDLIFRTHLHLQLYAHYHENHAWTQYDLIKLSSTMLKTFDDIGRRIKLVNIYMSCLLYSYEINMYLSCWRQRLDWLSVSARPVGVLSNIVVICQWAVFISFSSSQNIMSLYKVRYVNMLFCNIK